MSKPNLVFWSAEPRRYQPRTTLADGLPLLADASEAAFLLQRLYVLLGYPLDFGEALTPERRKEIEELARQLIAERRLT